MLTHPFCIANHAVGRPSKTRKRTNYSRYRKYNKRRVLGQERKQQSRAAEIEELHLDQAEELDRVLELQASVRKTIIQKGNNHPIDKRVHKIQKILDKYSSTHSG